MSTLPATSAPIVGLGMTALVVGTVGLMLSVFPVLGVPLAALGLLCGFIGLFNAARRGGPELRWTLAGIAASAAALTLNVAIVLAPPGYMQNPDVPQSWQPVPNRTYIPPPR